MAVMPKEVQDAFNQMKNVVLATATPDGAPNVDPMGMKKVIDAETVYISDQFFNKTLANLKENQKVAITFWGDEGAYQIHGTATYINEGEQFEELKAWVDGCFAAMMVRLSRRRAACSCTLTSSSPCSPGLNAGAKLA